jgi:hypothetical protein
VPSPYTAPETQFSGQFTSSEAPTAFVKLGILSMRSPQVMGWPFLQLSKRIEDARINTLVINFIDDEKII